MENPAKKRILYIITKSNMGGAQRYVLELATSLPKDAYEVAVACGGNGILVEKLREAGITIFEIKSFQRDINFKKEISSFFELRKIITEFDPDIIHLNSSKAGGIGALASRICRVKKIVFTAHGWAFWEDRSTLWRSIVWTLSWITGLLVHKIIVVSQYEYKRTMLPFTKHKFSVIKTAVPKIAFRDRDNARGSLYDDATVTLHEKDVWLITTAELTQNKNIALAVDAVITHNQTHAQKIFYSIMGDGELRQEIAGIIREKNAEQEVHLLGYIPAGREYLEAFDMFLLPSKKEGMPYALIEAGAAGLPSLASNVGGIPEIIEHNVSGMLIDPRESTSIISALEVLIENPELRVAQSEALHKKIETQFTLAEMIQKTEAIYRQ